MESLINNFYSNEDISDILWGIGAYNKKLKILSINDLKYLISFFGSSKNELSKLLEQNDKLSKILIYTIKNLLFESSYRANHLEYHKKDCVEKNDCLNKAIQKIFLKCEIISFFNCINCGNDIISTHKSYLDGICSNISCRKIYEEKIISDESNIIKGGEVSDKTLDELEKIKPYLLLIYPNEGKRVPLFIKDTEYDIEIDKNPSSKLSSTSIVFKNTILDSNLKIKNQILDKNKNLEYEEKINELQDYFLSNFVNIIGSKLLNIIIEKSIYNRYYYDNNRYKLYNSGYVNYYEELIFKLNHYNMMDLINTTYKNKLIMNSEQKHKFTDLRIR